MSTVRVGLIGLGGMGRTHFGCYRNNPDVRIVAICDVDPRKRSGDWSGTGINIDTGDTAQQAELAGIALYERYADMLADPSVDTVDICLPTSLHAAATIAALEAGKPVLCEKPMARTVAEGEAMAAAVAASGQPLMIGHCLRYWPQYVKAHEIIASGKYGKPFYARFYRSSATPIWSWDGWLTDGARSGGVVLDMHVHDVDTALWWFGKPESIRAEGITQNGCPLTVDSLWRYDNGLRVYHYGSWDNHGGGFQMRFEVRMEGATLTWDSARDSLLRLYTGGEQIEEIAVSDESAYQREVDDFIRCVRAGRKPERVTPETSLLSLEVVLEELRQIG